MATKGAKMQSSSLLVAAIDFGTTYSGWAFSFKHEFDADPVKVSAKQWSGGQLVSMKGPTCALINPDGESLHSFGYEAESKYAELAEEGHHKQWWFFKRFKMLLFEEGNLKRNMMIEDASGKEYPAKKVFSLCIQHLRDDLIKMSKNRITGGGLSDRDIHWVLTVPAIWNDAAKQFMREAAEFPPERGIPGDKLTIALEPEAASLFCRHLPVEKSGGEQFSLETFKPGTKYLVLDAGGGTIDITVHEVLQNGRLKELHKASGGAWGGTKVDDAFKQFIIKLVGAPVMKKFKDRHMEDYIDMFRDFEIKKRDISPNKDGKITFRVPTALTELFTEMTGDTLKDVLPQTTYGHRLSMTGDKLRVEAGIFKQFFDGAVKSILDHVANLLRKREVRGCSAIVMVGGFSESPMLQESVRNKFSKLKIIIPNEAGLAVLKGAVIYGHSPKTIAERVCKYTYGTNTTHTKSDLCTHPPGNTIAESDGIIRCEDLFSVHVKVGETIQVGEEQTELIYQPVYDDQTSMGFTFYGSSVKEPHFVTDNSCYKLGYLSFDVPDTTGGKNREVGVSMIFGGTEIEVKVVDKMTGKTEMTRVDFLG